MIGYISISIFFFGIGFFLKDLKKQFKTKKVKPLSKQNFGQAMKRLEIR